jgi:quercetin dioxygenase-like cupin family protein
METNQIERGKAQDLVTGVGYMPKSVVSKQVIKAPTGNITLFAFDEGEGLSEHSAPFDAFVQILDGEAEIIIGGKSNMVKTGEFIIMPANISHALKAIKKFKMMLVMIRS